MTIPNPNLRKSRRPRRSAACLGGFITALATQGCSNITTGPAEQSRDALRLPHPGMHDSPENHIDREVALHAVSTHDRAVYVKAGWIRDPYITIGPDGLYYLTGTTPNPGDPREQTEPYNVGLDEAERRLHGTENGSIVGYHARLWTSPNLVDWQEQPSPFNLTDGYWAKLDPEAFEGSRETWRLWAPEFHFIDGKWYVLHTTPGPVRGGSNLAATKGPKLQGPYDFPLGEDARWKHDPSLFVDTDGTTYLLWGNTEIVALEPGMTGFASEPTRIDPSGTRPDPANGRPITRIGHEGATMAKIGGKYVHFGTAWSTDRMRKGTYNLYYCLADSPTGPFGPRRFVGRFLGHGTPFQDKQGNWWCTAFFNADTPPLDADSSRNADLGETAQSINEQGVTLVPLEVRTTASGDVIIRAKDPNYRNPGPDEAQQFEIMQAE